jgi:hypothetical protein
MNRLGIKRLRDSCISASRNSFPNGPDTRFAPPGELSRSASPPVPAESLSASCPVLWVPAPTASVGRHTDDRRGQPSPGVGQTHHARGADGCPVTGGLNTSAIRFVLRVELRRNLSVAGPGARPGRLHPVRNRVVSARPFERTYRPTESGETTVKPADRQSPNSRQWSLRTHENPGGDSSHLPGEPSGARRADTPLIVVRRSKQCAVHCGARFDNLHQSRTPAFGSSEDVPESLTGHAHI